ncbi:MAG: hypothetical protein GAK31_00955 [Stenotrophomonas maltophilia]|uniref:Uncharacterized protein n=1 Tax=Stenotrophomonas maltophilia TaxID=40324 RepID=A0A7V8FKH5_STEMA|nr:MAG: hypothetical protein GAK31_00955 [Stenotrophomonas maltophilia]
MRWVRGGYRYITSLDKRFFISKANVRGSSVYTLTDGDERVCVERGEGAKERCMQRAEELAAAVAGQVRSFEHGKGGTRLASGQS